MLRYTTALVVAFCALAGSASAATYTVTNNGDPGAGSLRAAILGANADPAADVIVFSAGFAPGSELSVNSQLPAITGPTEIQGCSGVAMPLGACRGIRSAGGAILSVTGEDVTVDGLAFSGAATATAVNVTAVADDFRITRSFFGLRVNGTVVEPNATGLQLAGDSAEVGDEAPGTTNLFAGNTKAIKVFGSAVDNAIQGSSFGFDEFGADAPNAEAIEVVGTSGNVPQGTLIGGLLEGAPLTTEVCDGPCNLIGNTTGPAAIDLQGDAGDVPGSGTTIAGNQVGIDATGLAAENSGAAINVGGAAQTTVGGITDGHRNLIVGGARGVFSLNAADLVVRRNWVGLSRDGKAALAPPDLDGIVVAGAPGSRSLAAENRLAGPAGAGLGISAISASGLDRIQGNIIGIGTDGTLVGGGENGIIAQTDTIVGGDEPAEANYVGDTDGAGIRLSGATGTSVTGNRIGVRPDGTPAPNGGDGIRVEQRNNTSQSSDNTIGGDLVSEENVISNSAGAAIRVVTPSAVGQASVRNRILRNRGADNTGLFVDLGPGGPGNGSPADDPRVNDGIAAPLIATAGATQTTGTAQVGATVRLFRKDSDAPGGLGAFLGQAEPEPDGTWSLGHPAQEAGQRLTATQTHPNRGTSELSGIDRTDATPPLSSIDSGPTGTTPNNAPTFGFSSDDPGAALECALDMSAFSPCANSFSSPAQADGPHTFRVRATDSDSNTGPEVTRSFTVDTTPPETSVAIPARTGDSTPDASASSTDAGATFACSVDGGPFGSCGSLGPLADGAHTVRAVAADAVGNVDATPAEAHFTVDTVAPDTSFTRIPPALTTDNTPDVGVAATEAGSIVECAVDGGAYGPCAPLGPLPDGPHTISARATDDVGNLDATSATIAFAIDTVAPETALVGELKPRIRTSRPRLVLASEAGAVFECKVDAAAYEPCTSRFRTPRLKDGSHRVRVSARDAAGLVDRTPVTRSFVVDTKAPPVAIGRVLVRRGAAVLVRVSCPRSEAGGCRGRLSLNRNRKRVGSRRFDLTTGESARLRINLPARVTRGRVTAVVRARDDVGNAATDRRTLTVPRPQG